MSSKVSIKKAFDELFKGVKFDTSLHSKIIQNNIEFITSTDDHKQLFGGKAIGCYYLSYDFRHKDQFYSNLFGLETEQVIETIKTINTFDKNFKIANDDVNLTCMYIAHRFLNNTQMSPRKQLDCVKDILDYFSYRTLVLLHSGYWIYPISRERAVSLTERLSNRYTIKQVKNWNEYCKYRSEQYLSTKHFKILKNLNDDKAMPNAITDLYGKTKSTIKSIYREFIEMMENDEAMGSSRSVINDLEGNEVMLDRTGGIESYVIKLENALSDEKRFILTSHIAVSVDIIDSCTYEQLYKALDLVYEHTYTSSRNREEVHSIARDIVVNSVDYLIKNDIYMSSSGSILEIMDSLVGNVLYARGTDLEINRLKTRISKLLSTLHRRAKIRITERNVNNIRNAFYVYIILLALVD